MLTIAIPTYNRASELAAQLRNLTMAKGLGADFKVKVYDNASEDDTAGVVARARSSGLVVEYKRQVQNLGYQANVMDILEESKGRPGECWLWILGDDDIVQPPRIVELCELLAGDRSSPMVLCPFVTYTDTGRIVMHPPPPPAEAVAGEAGWMLIQRTTLVSSWVYRLGGSFDEAFAYALNHRQNVYIQVYLSAHILAHGNSFAVLARPVGFELANLTWRFRLKETFLEDKVESLHATRALFGLPSPGQVHYRRTMHAFLLRRCIYWLAAGDKATCQLALDVLGGESMRFRDRLLHVALRALELLGKPIQKSVLCIFSRRYSRARDAREHLFSLCG